MHAKQILPFLVGIHVSTIKKIVFLKKFHIILEVFLLNQGLVFPKILFFRTLGKIFTHLFFLYTLFFSNVFLIQLLNSSFLFHSKKSDCKKFPNLKPIGLSKYFLHYLLLFFLENTTVVFISLYFTFHENICHYMLLWIIPLM